MQYITVLTPENTRITYRLAGLGSRASAAVLDFIIIFLIMLIVFLGFLYVFFNGDFGAIGDFSTPLAFLLAIEFIIYYGYFIFTEYRFAGQTPGKMVLGLKVMRQNGSPAGIWPILIRNIIKLTVDSIGVGAFFVFFSKQCKRPGDYAASTVVVSLERVKTPAPFLADENPLSRPVSFALTDAERAALKDFFARADGFTDKGAFCEDALITHFSEKYNVERDLFTRDVLYCMACS